jgi:hypothetical protein
MNGATWPARVALLALLIVSLTLFWLRLRKVLPSSAAPAPRRASRSRRLARASASFWPKCSANRKSSNSAAWPGLAHAFVFWGFCAFSLITVNHIATGFGARFLRPNAGFGEFYYTFVAAWAVLVAVSIAGLFIRRFFVRPIWLGKTSPESGVIALLIFVLMITFLGGLWFDENSAGGVAMWWLHTLALLIFLPLIPHTKHLHLAAQPGHGLPEARRIQRHSAAERR